MTAQILEDFGERELIYRIRDIVAEHGGPELMLDDSACLQTSTRGETTWITTDPCPIPNLVQRLGMGDYYHAGWLCVVKSLSDLASMGASPLGVVVTVDFPRQTAIQTFDSFFNGVVACSSAHGTALLGGNIREARERSHAVSCAVGATRTKQALLRGAACPGDMLFVVDRADFGGFWAGIATQERKGKCSTLSEDLLSRVRSMALTPTAKVEQGQILLEKAPPRFCMDTSDGLLACALDLVALSDVDAVISLEDDIVAHEIHEVAAACNSDARAWALSWGTCHLLCSADRDAVVAAKAALETIGSELVVLGEVVSGHGKIIVDGQCVTKKASSLLGGYQFSPGSFWGGDVKRHVEDMMSKSIEDFLHG